MILKTSSAFGVPLFWRQLLGLLFFAGMATTSLALTPLPFAPVRDPLATEIAALSAIPDPTPAERARLRTLLRANDVLENSDLPDGKALRQLKNKLRAISDYDAPLESVAANLVGIYSNEYAFVEFLITQLPPSDETDAIIKQFEALLPSYVRLTNTISAKRISALYDPAKRRLENVLFRATRDLVIPFPLDLPTNTVVAKVDVGQGPRQFRANSVFASGNVFQAVATETNVTVTLSALDYQSGSLQRGIVFSVPNVRFGAFRYGIPDAASFTNRTDVDLFTGASNDTGATNGAIFIATTPTEVYGSFACSGPGFEITRGRFRIRLSSPP